MRKILSVVCAMGLFAVSAQAGCCPAFICLDMANIMSLGNQAQQKFNQLDQEVAREINNINKKIDRSHGEIEADSKVILENTRKLNRKYYVLRQDILHNQLLINELQVLLTDVISLNAQVKKSKNSLKLLKNEDTKK